MRDIDLDPLDYRPTPEKGQPVLKRGGLVRLAVFVAVVVAAVAFSYYFRPIVSDVVDWIRSAAGR
jgi:hypothetical protein